MEPHFDCQIVVVGHLMAGKTTLIWRLLLQHFDMSETKRTNGIIITHTGAICNKDGEWSTTENTEDSDQVIRRMQRAKEKGGQRVTSSRLSHAGFLNAEETYEEVHEVSRLAHLENGKGPKITVHFMDFAGQLLFNSTQQMFMTQRAIYLLVLDISKEVDSEVEDDDFDCVGANRRMTVEGLTEFLMRSIHVYRGDGPDSFPKVFLVGTHKDLVEEIIANTRMDRIVTKFKGTPLEKHVVGHFTVNCSITDDPEIDTLRQSIFQTAANEPHWGELTPTRWLPLERDIIKRRNNGERVLTMQTIRKMNTNCFAELQSTDEIDQFLRFHNSIGNMMYFGGSAQGDFVILDSQWLVDALKQLITYKQFFPTPTDVEDYMEDYTDVLSAKLSKKLIEAVWSKNEDKTSIIHMEQLLNILEQTDVIATPLTYNKDGKAESCSYYFVPTMLKPNPDGKAKIDKLLLFCRAKSPPLCFVFRDRFMQPAIFPRLQAECIRIYKLKEVQMQQLLFHQVAVFQLNQELDLIIENVGHIIKVTIINEKSVDINRENCENVLITIDGALKKIVRQYGDTTVYDIAEQCSETSTDHYEFIIFNDLEKSDSVRKENVPGLWFTHNNIMASSMCRSTKGTASILAKKDLGFVQIGRLARRLNPSELLLAAKTVVFESEWEQSKIDNKNNVVGQVYATLTKWRKNKRCLNIKMIHEAMRDSIELQLLQELVADTYLDTEFEGFDQTFLENKVSDEAIDLIAQNSPKTYRFVALELGIEHNEIETVVQDIDGVTHRAKKLLMEWKRRCSCPKYREIGRAILEVDMDTRLLADCERLWMETMGIVQKQTTCL